MLNLEQIRGYIARAVLTQPAGFCYRDRNIPGTTVCLYEPVTLEYLTSQNDEFNVPTDPEDPRLKTGCLIGTALTLAGETRHRADLVKSSNIIGVLQNFPDMMTHAAFVYCRRAQFLQDGGDSWVNVYQDCEQFIRDKIGIVPDERIDMSTDVWKYYSMDM